MYIGLTKNYYCNNLNILMVAICLRIFDPVSMIPFGEWSQSSSLDKLNKRVEQCEHFLDCFQFEISFWWKIHQYFSLSINLSIPTRLISVTWDYNRHGWIIGSLYLLQSNIDLNWTSRDLNLDLRDQKRLRYQCTMLHWQDSVFVILSRK